MFLRYRAEYLEGESRETVKKAAAEAYGAAVNLAKLALEETDPTRLGLMLNFSVFNYEVMKETEKACTLAKDAFDQVNAPQVNRPFYVSFNIFMHTCRMFLLFLLTYSLKLGECFKYLDCVSIIRFHNSRAI